MNTVVCVLVSFVEAGAQKATRTFCHGCEMAVRWRVSGDTTPCRMTGVTLHRLRKVTPVILHGVVSPEGGARVVRTARMTASVDWWCLCEVDMSYSF